MTLKPSMLPNGFRITRVMHILVLHWFDVSGTALNKERHHVATQRSLQPLSRQTQENRRAELIIWNTLNGMTCEVVDDRHGTAVDPINPQNFQSQGLQAPCRSQPSIAGHRVRMAHIGFAATLSRSRRFSINRTS